MFRGLVWCLSCDLEAVKSSVCGCASFDSVFGFASFPPLWVLILTVVCREVVVNVCRALFGALCYRCDLLVGLKLG